MKKTDRQKVFDKFHSRCAYCGDPLQKRWHVDHIIPLNVYLLAIDGVKPYINRIPDWLSHLTATDANHIDNLFPSCVSCNIMKSDMGLEQFREYITHFIMTLNRDITQYKFAKRYGLIQETGRLVVFYFETLKKE